MVREKIFHTDKHKPQSGACSVDITSSKGPKIAFDEAIIGLDIFRITLDFFFFTLFVCTVISNHVMVGKSVNKYLRQYLYTILVKLKLQLIENMGNKTISTLSLCTSI